MTLQRWFLATSLALISVTLIAAGALVYVTHVTTMQSAALVKKMERAQALRSLSRALSNHRRNDLLFSITHDAKYAAEAQRALSASATARDLLNRNASDGAETDENDLIAKEIQRYFDAATTSPQSDVDAIFEAVRETLYSLSEDRLSSAFVLQAEVARTERDAQLFSLLVVALSSLGTFVIMASLRRRLVRPVAGLLATIRAFQHRRPPPRLDLKGEFGTIQHALGDMNRTIEAHRAALLTFVSGVAHDLRNPLTAMRIVTQSIGPERPRPSDDKLRHVHATLEAQIRRLDHQLGDLLDSSQIEAGELRLAQEEADLTELVQQTIAVLDPGVRERVRLKLPERLPCRVDRVRIQQVLTNLVSNAIRYSKAGAPVVIEAQRKDGDVVISVRDEGIGIAADDLRRLFAPFERGRAPELKIPGTGLGLSVARKIVVAHGGKVSVESEVGKGSAFHVTLPAA